MYVGSWYLDEIDWGMKDRLAGKHRLDDFLERVDLYLQENREEMNKLPILREEKPVEAKSSSRGYVYAMVNPSMPGLVKVGKTKRNPEERAKELSSVTSIPMKFIVIYKAEVNDCDAGEAYVHQLLSSKSKRVNEHREFFEVKPEEAVRAILDYQQQEEAFGQSCERESEQELPSDMSRFEEELDLGDKFQYGEDGFTKDFFQARKHYKNALELATVRLDAVERGYEHLWGLYDSGKHPKEALEDFMDGAAICSTCKYRLAEYFADEGLCGMASQMGKSYSWFEHYIEDNVDQANAIALPDPDFNRHSANYMELCVEDIFNGKIPDFPISMWEKLAPRLGEWLEYEKGNFEKEKERHGDIDIA